MEEQKKPSWTFWIITGAVVAVFGVLIWVYVTGFDGETKMDVARMQVEVMAKACETYRKKPLANGKYPARLLELAVPPEGMNPVIEGGPPSLLDPWYEPYRYALVETKDGPVPHVWFEREIDGRLQLIGAKFVAGKAVRFGPPDR